MEDERVDHEGVMDGDGAMPEASNCIKVAVNCNPGLVVVEEMTIQVLLGGPALEQRDLEYLYALVTILRTLRFRFVWGWDSVGNG
jgi:hypothetical protein